MTAGPNNNHRDQQKNFYNSESQKMASQQYNPLTMTGRASVTTAATGLTVTPAFNSAKMPRQQCEQVNDSQINQNEFSSDILMKVKSGGNMSSQQHHQNAHHDYGQAQYVNKNAINSAYVQKKAQE